MPARGERLLMLPGTDAEIAPIAACSTGQLQVLTSLPPGAPFAPLNIQSAVANQTISKALATLETLKSSNNKTL